MAAGICFLYYLVLVAFIGLRSIRASEITDRSITLVNVSDEFAHAIRRVRLDLHDDERLDVFATDRRDPNLVVRGNFTT